MNGAADMGGMHGFGPVEIEPNEPVFHADWEKKAFALNMAIGVANIWNLDAFRFARESLPPPQYLNTSYYGLWVVTLENYDAEIRHCDRRRTQSGPRTCTDEESGRAGYCGESGKHGSLRLALWSPSTGPAKIQGGRQGARA